MDDCISRQAAIDIFNQRAEELRGVYGDLGGACSGATKLIESLPYVQSDRKIGKWYKPTGMMPPEYIGVYACSVCDAFAMRSWKHHTQVLTNFCPNCGADMRGERDG